jgi:hypothetical protein
MSDAIIKSSGNVFIDLGYSPEEAAILQMVLILWTSFASLLKPRNLRRLMLRKFCVSVSPEYPI